LKPDIPHILLVNPWIHDFAAYDFWAKPVGILTLASILRSHGYAVEYIDCLNRFHPSAPETDPYARSGRGPYGKSPLPNPAGLQNVRRKFSRYGIRPEWFLQDLQAAHRPDLILVTSVMTYWYPGVQETIRMIRTVYPDVPVILGGIYATLCREHAIRYSGADRIVSGAGEEFVLKLAGSMTGFPVSMNFDPEDLNTYPYPAFDLQTRIGYIPMLTSRGCPFRCAYCASHILDPERMVRDPRHVMEEIRYWHTAAGVRDFVFYDDALLVNAPELALPLFEEIVRSGLPLRFHTPNAVHIREITKDMAGLMMKAGFETLRLGLETTGFNKRSRLDRKVNEAEFRSAVTCLKSAGFQSKQIGAYLLCGLPGQSVESVEESIRVVKETGITPVLAYYSPIPGTRLWKDAIECSRYDLASDPIFTNNAVMPCRPEGFSWETISRLKKMAAGN